MNTDKQITVQIKSIYGNEMIYPICPQAKIFAELAGTKTLTRTAINLIKDLGFKVNVVALPSTL